MPAWHCPVAPQGSRAETYTAGATHLPCSAGGMALSEVLSCPQGQFEESPLSPDRPLGFKGSASTCHMRSKPCKLIHSLQTDTSHVLIQNLVCSRAGTSALAVLPRSFRGNIKRGGYQTELGHLDGSIKKVLFTSTGNKVSSPQS